MEEGIKKERIYAFIDSQNLNLGIKRCGWKLDFQKFFVYLQDKYRVEKAFLFIGYIPKNEWLYNDLKNAGYQLIFKPTQYGQNMSKKVVKGNVDAELVLHTMLQYPDYDKAMIVSGDGDFYCLIEYLCIQKKLGYIAIPDSKKFSALLRIYRPYFFFVDKLRKKLEKKNEKE